MSTSAAIADSWWLGTVALLPGDCPRLSISGTGTDAARLPSTSSPRQARGLSLSKAGEPVEGSSPKSDGGASPLRTLVSNEG